MKPYFLFIAFALSSCGGSSENPVGSNPSNQNLQALKDTPELRRALADDSPLGACPHEEVYLAGISWSIVNGSPFDLATQDVIQIDEDCVFQSFACGTMGYIISGGSSFNRGLVEVQMVGHLFPHPTCYQLGHHLCSYVEDGAGELRISCQLLEPQGGPYAY